MNNIVRCPYCYMTGETKNLAQIQDDGGIKILRMNGTVDFTVIYASEFTLQCGACMNMVIYKQAKHITPLTDITIMWGTIMNYYAN